MKTRDLRIESIRPLLPPALLLEELPLTEKGSVMVAGARDEVINILNGVDDRLMVVVGPCSIHDTEAALDYARRLLVLRQELAADLCIVMRVYFEKPRTTIGWKGLINDPHLNEGYAVNEGLRIGRHLLLDLVEMGMPAGCEFLDPITPQFFADIVVWSAIGARTTESQVHRNLASGLSMPVGFKNGTGGNLQIAVDAIRAASYPHSFLSVTEQGLAGIVTTTGNQDCHLILRGGDAGPNFEEGSVQEALALLRKNNLQPRLMIDTSHGNSKKDYRNQPAVAKDIAAQVAAGEMGINSLLMESFLVDGRQDLKPETRDLLVYGQSITDSCMGWEMTVPVLHEMAAAVRARRDRRAGKARGEAVAVS